MTPLLLAMATAFLATLLLAPPARAFLIDSGIVGIDQQKSERPELPTSGGIIVLFGFLAGISVYIGLVTFVTGAAVDVAILFAALSATFIIGMIGLIDDIHVDRSGVEEKGNEQIRVGLAQHYKFLAPLAAALPLMVAEAGQTTMHLPVLGAVHFGVLFPLVLVPIAVTCVVNATNMLAGQNGMAAGMGTIALAGVGTFALANGRVEAAAVALPMAAALGAFLKYNAYPASILPGDSLTYAVGAAYVAAVVIGNVETFGIVVFLPWIAEAFLKLRSGFAASSLGDLQSDGTLRSQHERIYSVTHVLMRFDLTEREIVLAAWTLEAVVVIAAFGLFL